MIKRGDRVKLTARVAAAFNKARKFDWTDRRGVVERMTASKATAIVLWDGRKSQEYLPIRSIELEPAELGTEDRARSLFADATRDAVGVFGKL